MLGEFVISSFLPCHSKNLKWRMDQCYNSVLLGKQRKIHPQGVRAAAAAKSLQSCLTLCDPIDGSPPGYPIPGILQARTLEWVAISFSNAWKWKVKVKLLSRVQLLATPWTTAHQALCPWDFPGKSTGVGCHCLLHKFIWVCPLPWIIVNLHLYARNVLTFPLPLNSCTWFSLSS